MIVGKGTLTLNGKEVGNVTRMSMDMGDPKGDETGGVVICRSSNKSFKAIDPITLFSTWRPHKIRLKGYRKLTNKYFRRIWPESWIIKRYKARTTKPKTKKHGRQQLFRRK